MKVLTSFDNFDLDNFKIKDLGVGLSEDVKIQLRRKLQTLQLKAPALSYIHLSYFPHGDEIKGSLNIHSPGKIFRSVINGDCPLLVFNKLEEEINQQLWDWKKSRFTENYFTPTFSQTSYGGQRS